MYYLLILAVGVERLIELFVAKRNARWAFSQGGKEFGHNHYPVMVTLHTALLLGCVLEVWGCTGPLSVGWVGQCSPWRQPVRCCAGGVWRRWADGGTPWSSWFRTRPWYDEVRTGFCTTRTMWQSSPKGWRCLWCTRHG